VEEVVRVRVLAAALSLALMGAGCAALVRQPGPRDVSGPTDGYEPTSSFLKVFVRTQDGNQTLIDFDRRDWYAAGIVKKLDDRSITFVTVHGEEREVLSEVVVETVKAPDELAAMKFDSMHATAQQRSVMDTEYEQLLATLAATPTAQAVSVPTVP